MTNTAGIRLNGRIATKTAFLALAACSAMLLGMVLAACGGKSPAVVMTSTAGIEYVSYAHVTGTTDDIRFYRFDVRDGCLVVSPVDRPGDDVSAGVPRNWYRDEVAALAGSWHVDADGVTLSDGTRARWGDIVQGTGSVNVTAEYPSPLPKSDCVSRYGGYRAIIEDATSFGALDSADVERRGAIGAYTLSLIRAVNADTDAQSVRVADADPAFLPKAPPATEQAMRAYLDEYVAGDKWGPATTEGLEGLLPVGLAHGGFAYLMAIRDMRSVWTLSPGADKAALLVLLNADDVDIYDDPSRPKAIGEGRTGLSLEVYGASDPQRNDTVFYSATTAQLLGTVQFDAAADPGPDGVIRPVESIYWD